MSQGGTNGDDDEEWMPPADSPLFTSQPSLAELSSAKYSNKSLNYSRDGDSVEETSPDDIAEDEIQVIDIEATLKNEANQRLLQDELDDASQASPPEFDVESEDVGWKEVLRELRDAGKTQMMERLVIEYNLQSYLENLDDDVVPDLEEDTYGNSATEISDEEWDEEFEQSLKGLSQEELVDELIENSPSLSQLEMEILSDELEKSEEHESGKGGLDYDSLEELNLEDNTAYSDFRAMVLEDYNEKKQANAYGGKINEGKVLETEAIAQQSASGGQFSTKSDFEVYPPDWKDYDSKAAFKRDFSEEDSDWVPPSSEFIPSSSNNVDESHAKDPPKAKDNLDNKIDWLQARRSRLGLSNEKEDGLKPTHLLTPEQAEAFRHQNSQIEVKPYTLFTTAELSGSLAAQGGTDIHIIDTSEFQETHGVGIGSNYIMLVTGRNTSHIRVMADSVVKNLKARRLAERGVMGAMKGAEGGEDIFSNKRTRNRARRNGALNTSGKIDDDWMAIDCENIHVHILEETTRQCLNIESLWDLSNPNSEGSKLRRVDLADEDQVDTYVAENPIPDEYAAKIFSDGGGRKTDGWISGTGGRVHSVSASQRKSFSKKWSGKSQSKGRQQRG